MARWIVSVIIIAALIFGSVQLVWLNKGLSELQERADKQASELGEQNKQLSGLTEKVENMAGLLQEVTEKQTTRYALPDEEDTSVENALLRDIPPLMVLRFADAIKEHYDVVRPLLNARGWKGTFAIPCSAVGNEGKMSVAELKTLAEEGHEISGHGWTHAYDSQTQTLTADAFTGAAVLILDTLSGLGGPLSSKYYTKTKLSDDANPEGEYVEIIALDYNTLQVTLREGIVKNYTVADNAKLKMDRECISTHFTNMKMWFRYTICDQLYIPLTIIQPGGDESHQEYWWMYAARDFMVVPGMSGEYYTHNWRIDKGISETVLRYKGDGSISGFWGHNRVEQVRAIISNRAQPGLVSHCVWHGIKDSHPGYGDDLNEFKSILDLIDSLGYRVVTLATAGQIIRQYSKKDVVLCFYEDNLNASSVIDTGVPVDLTGFHSVILTVEATYHGDATAGAKLRLYSSADGKNWDTEPIDARTVAFEAGETKRETFTPSDAAQRARFLKVTIENLDAAHVVTNVKVTATLGT